MRSREKIAIALPHRTLPVISTEATRFLAHGLCALGRVGRNLSFSSKSCRKAIIFFLAALCSMAPRLATCQTSDEQIELSFRAGQRALKQSQFALAAEEFKKVLALDPTLVEAEVNLGLAYD